ncbi:MAG: mechanosensitive ion channel, partial [Acidobacteria bacterium]|nr:mechanosensitive ion channel [Acidobacteriota bacterium]
MAASVGITLVLLGAIFYVRRRLRIVRALTFVLGLAAVAIGLAVYKATGVRLLPDFEAFFVWMIATLVAITVLRLAGLYLFDVYLRIQRGVRVPPLLPSLSLAVAYLLAALLTLRAVYPGLNLAPLLATSAVTSLVLGLALQPILGNFFAGVAISFEQPYRINDWIKIGDIEGRVVDMTWRTTHLRTRDNDDLVIPNAKAADEYILNCHYPTPLHLARIYVGAHMAAPPYRVKHVLLECVSIVP